MKTVKKEKEDSECQHIGLEDFNNVIVTMVT